MSKINLETVRGMRDFLPEDKILRDEVTGKIKKVFENYGFAPFDTPVLENSDLLMGKNQYGDEALKLVYEFTDKGGRRIGLRYDFTVPLVRVVAMNPQLPKPFKCYRIDKVWRYERPQSGRYREFYQCDIDTVGTESPMADAEIIACANAALKAIGFEKFTFRINSRNIMNELLEGTGVAKTQVTRTLRVLDKRDKITEEELANELRTFLSESSVDDLIGLMKLKGNWNVISSSLKICDVNRKVIEEFLKYLKDFGITNFVFDLSLARGLDYYTGFVFEIDAGKEIGSIGGGGRYDDMIGNFTGQKVAATGISLGLERIIDLLKMKKIKTKTRVYVIPIKIIDKAIEIAEKIRNSGVNADIDLSGRDLKKNLDYVNKMEIPYVVFVGEQELKAGKVKLRNMSTGSEDLLDLRDAIENIKRH